MKKWRCPVKSYLDDGGNVVVYEDCRCKATAYDFRPCALHQPKGDGKEFLARQQRFLEAASITQEKYNKEGLHAAMKTFHDDIWDAEMNDR